MTDFFSTKYEIPTRCLGPVLHSQYKLRIGSCYSWNKFIPLTNRNQK